MLREIEAIIEKDSTVKLLEPIYPLHPKTVFHWSCVGGISFVELSRIFHCRKLDQIRVKGRSVPIHLYEVYETDYCKIMGEKNRKPPSHL